MIRDVIPLLFPFAAFVVFGMVLRSVLSILIAVLAGPVLLFAFATGILSDSGLGEGWQPLLIAFSAASAVGAVVGVVVGRFLFGRVD